MTKIALICLLLPVTALAQKGEKWIDNPREQWPSIAMTNQVLYKNGDRYLDPSLTYAGTGFLIDTGADTLAATAKHVLWIAKNKKSNLVQINEELRSWTMMPKGSKTDSAVIGRLLNEDSTEILQGPGSTILQRDWLVFSVTNASPNIYPLKPRYTALRPNEKVYILSCAYRDSICKSYEGIIFKKQGMDILIELDQEDQLGGASGSPVIDANGYLIGIMSSTASSNKPGKMNWVAVSTEYLYNVLNKKSGLNTPKKDYGELILKTVLNQGTKKAIQQYINLSSNPQNYYIYNLRTADRNGLRETGRETNRDETRKRCH